MDILFSTTRLRRQCTREQAIVRTWGPERARRLKRRLDDLRAAPNLETMKQLPGRCHELTGDRKGQFSIDLDGPYRLLFEPAQDPPPVKEDGGFDWEAITTIRILGVEDTHA
jgi:plasmid maintenance system killer protein